MKTRQMKLKTLTFFISIIMIITIISLSQMAIGMSNGKTGSTDFCSPCHSASADPSVSVDISGIPEIYVNGTTYPLTISLSPPGSIGGFNLEVDNGIFSNGDANVLIPSNREATQSTGLSGTWTLDWTAPSDYTGVVTFDVAGLVSDNDGTLSGDLWNTNSYTNRGESEIEFKDTTLVLTTPATTIFNTVTTFSALLSDEDGTPLENMTIMFYREATFGYVISGVNTTNALGIATIPYNFSYIPGNFTIAFKSEFNGTDNFNKSTGNSATEMEPVYYIEQTESVVPSIIKFLVIITVSGVWLVYAYIMYQILGIWNEGRKNPEGGEDNGQA